MATVLLLLILLFCMVAPSSELANIIYISSESHLNTILFIPES